VTGRHQVDLGEAARLSSNFLDIDPRIAAASRDGDHNDRATSRIAVKNVGECARGTLVVDALDLGHGAKHMEKPRQVRFP
jgi:hypothetical protein